ncbi:hypothetical protein H5410_040953 [Solanum commersonii]|uniref:AIPP2-like SPOC-like domain-containing protein n=1 Tax=Solanum commersonii TaxID=4109 RepID=A0A9J5XSA9_SOLCO|nr:hypothetical protein H5410_040953 [Solanum commersonii]
MSYNSRKLMDPNSFDGSKESNVWLIRVSKNHEYKQEFNGEYDFTWGNVVEASGVVKIFMGFRGSSNFYEQKLKRSMNSNPVPPGTDLVEHSHDVQLVDDPYELDRVVAHLSDRACQSVSEKSKLLLLYLHFEMFSKNDLWHEYFNTSEANADDIELFFFPSEARVYALRALTPYGELLVFTSTKLPLPHWN